MQISPECASYIRSVAYATGYRTLGCLAEACQCSVSLLSRVLAGKRRASERLVARLESSLHLQPGTIRSHHETAA